MPSLASLAILNTTAPAMTGIDMRKLARAAESRSKPRKRAAVMVMPLRDVPGFNARICAAPTFSASLLP